MDMILAKCIDISKYVFLISVTYVVGAHSNFLIEAIPMCTYNIGKFKKVVSFTINSF